MSSWKHLPSGAMFEPLTQRTVEELSLISELMAVTRSTMETGSFGFSSHIEAGPLVIMVEEGVMELGPIETSPKSRPEPAVLVRPAGEGAELAFLTPNTIADLGSGEMVFFPTKTGFQAGLADRGVPATYLQFEVFPIHTTSDEDAPSAALPAADIGAEVGGASAPPSTDMSRLTLDPDASLLAPPAVTGPQLFYLEQGDGAVTRFDGSIQLQKEQWHAPGVTVEPEVELRNIKSGDAFLVPPGGSVTIQNGAELATFLVLEIGTHD